MDFGKYHIAWMQLFLGLAFIALVVSFRRAHKDPRFEFNVFDMIMEDGKVAPLQVVFMIVFAVSTWVIVDLQIKDKLTEGLFGLWLGAWATPLVAKIVFKKNDITVIQNVQQPPANPPPV